MAATQTEPVAEVEKAAVLITKTAEASAELLAPLQPLAVEAKAATEKLKLKRRWSLREIFYVRQEKKMQKQQQCSWTLDKVTVIRNELVDSDIEIVLGRSAPEKLPLTPSGDAASKWKMSSPHWTRWVTRWVRVERTAK
ncbi:MAG: hypothetical protein JWM04_2298 [Verrucomicrobiales bacterium]|nr:hypothetical protein [Verrucomicrobiales bacterium]